MDYICVANWNTFQHYKDRNPPWIKLYNELLDDYDFFMMPDEAKAHLICIWLLASRVDNKIPYEPLWVQQKIAAKSPVNLKALVELGYLKIWTADVTKTDWDSRYIPDEIRKKIRKKYKDKCAKCESKLFLEIDHIVPISKGGETKEDNLQLLCRSCNRKKYNSLSDKCYGKRSIVLQGDDGKCCPEESRERGEKRQSKETPTPLKKGSGVSLEQRRVEEIRQRFEFAFQEVCWTCGVNSGIIGRSTQYNALYCDERKCKQNAMGIE